MNGQAPARIVVDPNTGEQFEVADDRLVGAEPYDFGSYKRMTMTIRTQHEAAITAVALAGKAVARATGEYHKQIALTVPRMKVEHGATVAESMAKGERNVRDAKEALISAEADERAAMETVRMIRDDRSSALTLGAWSREAGAEGWDR